MTNSRYKSSHTQYTCTAVIHRYKVALKDTYVRDLKLQSQLDTDCCEYEQQLSKLKKEILEMRKKTSVVKEQHLKDLQQKGKKHLFY